MSRLIIRTAWVTAANRVEVLYEIPTTDPRWVLHDEDNVPESVLQDEINRQRAELERQQREIIEAAEAEKRAAAAKDAPAPPPADAGKPAEVKAPDKPKVTVTLDLIDLLERCQQTGEWDGPQLHEEDLTLPTWTYEREDEDLSDLELEAIA